MLLYDRNQFLKNQSTLIPGSSPGNRSFTLFYVWLFNDVVSSLDFLAPDDGVIKKRVINWNGHGKKQSWPNSSHYPGTSRKDQEKPRTPCQDFRSPGKD
jgi:hypothetical protein